MNTRGVIRIYLPQAKISPVYFRGKSHFENDGTRNYLAFQPTQRHLKMVSNTHDYIL